MHNLSKLISPCARVAGRKEKNRTQFIDTIVEIVTTASQLDRFARRGPHFSLKIENPPFMPLVIEAWGWPIPRESRRISVVHYLEQSCDLVPDPEVEITDTGWPIRALRVSQVLCYTQVTVYSADGRTMRYAPESRPSVLNFPNDSWAQNLRVQRFVESARKLGPQEEAAHDHPT